MIFKRVGNYSDLVAWREIRPGESIGVVIKPFAECVNQCIFQKMTALVRPPAVCDGQSVQKGTPHSRAAHRLSASSILDSRRAFRSGSVTRERDSRRNSALRRQYSGSASRSARKSDTLGISIFTSCNHFTTDRDLTEMAVGD